MGRLYLIRHGETDSNKSYRFQGQTDIELNAKGKAQAQLLAEHFKDIKLDKIYCSSLLRARQTAEPMAQTHGLAVETVDDIKEIAFGEWEGMTFDEINSKWPGEIDAFFKNPALCHVPGGENFTAVAARVEPFFKRCLAEMDDKDIAIVSHGGIIRVLLCLFLGVDLNNIWNFSVGNCSTSTLAKWRGFTTVLENTNATYYLR